MEQKMKKAFKIIVPIFLAIALIATTIWYLFVYDTEFTQDMLLRCARYFERNGSHSVAEWFYDWAYEHSDDNDSVAIELAEQYLETGNYTKAEYTLYNAIQDGGGVELYITLCNIYVEQDKLLDALNLLQNTSGEVRDQLEALRPADPEASHEPGLYNDRISISFTAPQGQVYVTTEAVECPSLNKDLFKEPYSLEEGSNIFYAICVGENGLVSPVRTYEYILGGIVEEVKFSDKAVDKTIRKMLHLSEDAVIYTNTLWNVLEFTMPEDAKDYSDLKFLPNLEKLTIQKAKRDELDNLLLCPKLTKLEITESSVSDDVMEIIGSMTAMEELTLSNCGLSTISKLELLTSLKKVNLDNNTIRDISIFENTPHLEELSLMHNAVEDITPLAGCSKLRHLALGYNNIASIETAFSFPILQYLDVQHNAVASISGIEKLKELTQLNASYNKLTDISMLATSTNLMHLDVASNQITDLSALAGLNGLMHLYFSYNQVTEIPTWSSESMLVTIDGSHNLITTLEPLAGLPILNNVLMDYNEEIESVDCLVTCHALVKVNVYGTKVKDVSALAGTDPETGLPFGVIVNYNPTDIENDEVADENS